MDSTNKKFTRTDGSRIKLIKDKSNVEKNKNIRIYRPPNQQVLTQEEMNEEHPRIITNYSDFCPDNTIVFSYKKGTFVKTNQIDNSHVHFKLTGNLMHQNTADGKKYLADLKAVELAKSSTTESNKSYMDEYIDENGDIKFRLLKNQFNFTERESMTYNCLTKEFGTNTEKIELIKFSDLVNPVVIYEAYEDDLKKQMLIASTKKKKKTPYKISTRRNQIKESDRLIDSTLLVERIILQNELDDIFQDYRYFEDDADELREDHQGSMLPLWVFTDVLMKKMYISSICWHPLYPDLFAVGLKDYLEKSNGFVMLFSLKKPEGFIKKFDSSSGCMSLDFHKNNSYLLAAGYYDGSVKIYDLRQEDKKMDIIFDENQEKHYDPVWQVKWQNDNCDKNKNFFSISSDGRVINWILKKNKVFSYEIIRMNQIDLRNTFQESNLLNAGTCLDFNTNPSDIFLVGTEEGKIFEYSTSYKSLQTSFDAHLMPVYTVKWNVFHKKVFISASADWTVKIWDHRFKFPVFNFEFGEPVADVDWAPYSSTVFAAITISGVVCIYDLSISTNNPICNQNILMNGKHSNFTRVAFNLHSPTLLISDTSGHIYSLKLSPNLRISPKDDKLQKIEILNKENFEIAKLRAIIKTITKESDFEKAETNRKDNDLIQTKENKVKNNDDH